jgi:hypothetical protein
MAGMRDTFKGSPKPAKAKKKKKSPKTPKITYGRTSED